MSVCLLYLIFVQLVNLLLLLVWVPNWSSTLCDLGVFVYQPAEQIATSKMKVGMTMSQVTAVDELFGTHRLRAKLGPEHEQLIATVRNVGYKFVRPLSPRQRTEQQHPANADTEAVEPTTDPYQQVTGSATLPERVAYPTRDLTAWLVVPGGSNI